MTHLQGLETAFQRLRSAKDLCSDTMVCPHCRIRQSVVCGSSLQEKGSLLVPVNRLKTFGDKLGRMERSSASSLALDSAGELMMCVSRPPGRSRNRL